jgi:hypothetical protein
MRSSNLRRDELVREVEMYQRMAYRYRNAATSMRRRYEEYAAAVPADVPRVTVEPASAPDRRVMA